MRRKMVILLSAVVWLLSGCTIDPPLHLRKTAQTKILMQTSFSLDMMWQVDWETRWQFGWRPEVAGPLGYKAPTGIRMHIYTLGDDSLPLRHNVYNFSGLSGEAQVFLGVHDFLFHNNGSEVNLFKAENELADPYAYTRIISSRLRSSIPVMTTRQKASSGTRAGEGDEIEEPVAFQPDELFVLLDPSHKITDNLDEYEYEDGRYVLKIRGELTPATYIYLFQIRLLNNLDRVTGSMGGAALTGMAEEVNMRTRQTSLSTVSVPTDVYYYPDTDPDLLGARVMTFGLPGCDPADPASAAAAPSGRHYLVLNVNFKTGRYKNIRIDVTDQIRELPTGGVIPIEIDVNDFPPEDVDPPVTDGGGFKPLVGDWGEETGSTTITN